MIKEYNHEHSHLVHLMWHQPSLHDAHVQRKNWTLSFKSFDHPSVFGQTEVPQGHLVNVLLSYAWVDGFEPRADLDLIWIQNLDLGSDPIWSNPTSRGTDLDPTHPELWTQIRASRICLYFSPQKGLKNLFLDVNPAFLHHFLLHNDSICTGPRESSYFQFFPPLCLPRVQNYSPNTSDPVRLAWGQHLRGLERPNPAFSSLTSSTVWHPGKLRMSKYFVTSFHDWDGSSKKEPHIDWSSWMCLRGEMRSFWPNGDHFRGIM